jgi:hypothetical protein
MRYIAGIAALFTLGACNSAPSTPPDQPITTAVDQPLTTAAANDVVEVASNKLWNTKQYADRHSCPSDRCGVVGRLVFREAAEPLERKSGWVRTTKYYDAACEGGESQYVKTGNRACTSANGITDGKFAEWVREDQLSKTRPPDPAEKATAEERLVKDSSDFNLYHAQFAKLAAMLIAERGCSESDFVEQGGFVKSVNRQDEPIYFIYCGGMTAANKVYVNVRTVSVE